MHDYNDYDAQVEATFDDFVTFLCVLWAVQGLPAPGRVQEEIADWLQHGPSRKQVQAMRGAGKSFIAYAYVIWYLGNNPNHEVLIVSKTEKKAKEFCHLVRTWIKLLAPHLDWVADLEPRKGQRNEVLAFDVGTRETAGHSASVSACGITGQLTGNRAHLIILDDVETQDNSRTQIQREWLLAKISEVESIIQPDGTVLINGTPHSYESVYSTLALAYEVRRWPARYPDPSREDWDKWLHPRIRDEVVEGQVKPGTPTFPERYDHEELLRREAAMGPARFRLQFLLDTTLTDAERFPLKLKDLMVFTFSGDRVPAEIHWGPNITNRVDPNTYDNPGFRGDWLHYPQSTSQSGVDIGERVMYVDPSGSGNDDTAWTVGCFANGYIGVTAAGGRQDGASPETLRCIGLDAYDNKVHKILVENYGGDTWANLLRSALPAVYRERNSGKAKPYQLRVPEIVVVTAGRMHKEARILNALIPLFSQHRICLAEHLLDNEPLLYQITHLTWDRDCLNHDDHVDAFAGLCGYFGEQLQVDQEAEAQRAQMEEILQYARRFGSRDGSLRGVVGPRSNGQNRSRRSRELFEQPTGGPQTPSPGDEEFTRVEGPFDLEAFTGDSRGRSGKAV